MNTITWYSNSPAVGTGYGTQTAQVVKRLMRDGYKVACVGNYGAEGVTTSWDSGFGSVPVFFRGFDNYSNDITPVHHKRWAAENGGKAVLFTLYDSWVLTGKGYDELPIVSWTPVDHQPMPPRVLKWLQKPNVTPVAMSKFGLSEMVKAGLEAEYVPHAFDEVFTPTATVGGVPTREWLGVPKDAFLIGMNAANKGVAPIRKAFGEAFLAFKLFADRHPDAFLYVHSDLFGHAGGIDLTDLAGACGISKEQILFADPIEYRYGYTQDQVAAIYSACDVGLTISLGEGFGLATIEFQACGVPVVTSNFAASAELAGPQSFLVGGQPWWDAAQGSWFNTPAVSSTVNALEQAYDQRKESKQPTLDWVQQYAAETVFQEHWLPLLSKVFA